MTTLPWLALYVYGTLLIAGGVMGYAKVGSKGSLTAGVVGGLLAILFAWYGSHGSPEEAKIGSITLALLLSSVMAWRFAKTKKPMPALPIIVFSLIVAALQFV